jgi:hypothetical protein
MRESMKDLKIVDVPAEIRAGTSSVQVTIITALATLLGMTVRIFIHIHNV